MALTPSGGGKSGFLVKPLCSVLGERTSLCCHFLLAIGGCCFQLNSCSSYCIGSGGVEILGWCVWLATTASSSSRQPSGGAVPTAIRDRTRSPRPSRVPRDSILLLPWSGSAPSPYDLIRETLLVDPELISLREPDPEPSPGEEDRESRLDTIGQWLALHDSAPDLAQLVLSNAETFDSFEWIIPQ